MCDGYRYLLTGTIWNSLYSFSLHLCQQIFMLVWWIKAVKIIYFLFGGEFSRFSKEPFSPCPPPNITHCPISSIPNSKSRAWHLTVTLTCSWPSYIKLQAVETKPGTIHDTNVDHCQFCIYFFSELDCPSWIPFLHFFDKLRSKADSCLNWYLTEETNIWIKIFKGKSQSVSIVVIWQLRFSG